MTERAAHRDRVAVAQARAPVHPLAVDVGAVVRAPVVDEGPLVAEPLDARVHARDLRVPRQRDVVGRAAPDRQPLGHVAEVEDLLRALAVAKQQERPHPPLGLDALLQLGGRRAVQGVGELHRIQLYAGCRAWTQDFGASGARRVRESDEIAHREVVGVSASNVRISASSAGVHVGICAGRSCGSRFEQADEHLRDDPAAHGPEAGAACRRSAPCLAQDVVPQRRGAQERLLAALGGSSASRRRDCSSSALSGFIAHGPRDVRPRWQPERRPALEVQARQAPLAVGRQREER